MARRLRYVGKLVDRYTKTKEEMREDYDIIYSIDSYYECLHCDDKLKIIKDYAYGYDIEVKFICPNCGSKYTMQGSIDFKFFEEEE